jgi:CrcB protein
MMVVSIAVAGALGVLARYGLTAAVAGAWTVVAVNLAGCFGLGLLTTAGGDLSSDVRLALGTGFLGGFTTFSTFAVQVVADADAGRPGAAGAYLATSVAGGIAAAALGWAVGRAVA